LQVEVAHLEQLHIGEVQHGADIVRFRIEHQRGIPVYHRHILEPEGDAEIGCLPDFLFRHRRWFAAQDPGDDRCVGSADRCGLHRRFHGLHSIDRVVLGQVGHLRPLNRGAQSTNQRLDPGTGVLAQRFPLP
jgi:hypothetical protein